MLGAHCFSQTAAKQGASAESVRRHSSPVLTVKTDHVAEIARLIGVVSAETQRVREGGGEEDSRALTELKLYLQRWPEAQATLEDQVQFYVTRTAYAADVNNSNK